MLIALGLVCSHGHAQVPVGKNVVFGPDEAAASAPGAAANSDDGSFLAVWTDDEQNTAGTPAAFQRVLGRRIKGDGTLLGEAFVISRQVADDPSLGGSRPEAIYNPQTKEYLAVYDRDYAGSTNQGIWGQRITAAGALAGDELPVALSPGQRSPVLAYGSVGQNYLVVWSAAAGLAGTALSGSGAALNVTNTVAAAGAANPALTYLPSANRFLLAFDTPAGTSGRAVFGQWLTAIGELIDAPFRIDTSLGNQVAPSVAFNRDTSRSVVVWVEDNPGVAPNIFGQLIDGSGKPVGARTLLSQGRFPRISYSAATKRFFLTWLGNLDVNGRGVVFGRSLRANLDFAGARVTLSDSTAADAPTLAATGDAALAGWLQAGASGSAVMAGQVVDVSESAARPSIAMTASPTPARLGEALTFRIRVSNPGPGKAKAVVLKDTLADGLSFGEAVSDAGSCTFESPTVTCSLGDIAAGAAVTVRLTTTPARLGKIANTATLNWDNGGTGSNGRSASVAARIRYPGKLAFIAPVGGETLAAGSTYPVGWDVIGGNPSDALNFRLRYSANGGTTWSLIAQGLTGRQFDWVIAPPAKNAKAKLEITGFTADGKTIGRTKTKGRFTVELVKLTSPNGGETLQAGTSVSVTWTTYGTRSPVARVTVSQNLGGRWRPVADLEGNPGSYAWNVPAPARTGQRSKLRVSLRDEAGREVARDMSDGFFAVVQ